jgi:23S rRNA (uracil1939-C5)-methyltransferase
MAYGGDAFGREPSGRMLFVPFALPGERVRVRVEEVHERWARATLLEVLASSPDRIPPRCRHFAVCGGCHYQHLSYAAQLRLKAEIVRSQLERLGGFESPPVEPTVASPSPWNTRNHLQFSLNREGRLGFQAAGSHRVVAIEECHLPDPSLADLWPRLDLAPIPGLLRVVLRSGADGETMIALEAETEPEVELALDLPASVVWVGPGGASVLAGGDRLMQDVLGRRFVVRAASFFQVNSSLTGDLVRRVLEALLPQSGETVFDLYAGVGLFSAFVAAAGARVVAVEESPEACADFEANLTEFDSVDLYESPVEVALPAIPARPDAAIVDPPRAGLERAALEALITCSPRRLVYVSCDPATLARDGKRLAQAGYHLERVTPIDLFPQTYHIETLSLWLRAGEVKSTR